MGFDHDFLVAKCVTEEGIGKLVGGKKIVNCEVETPLYDMRDNKTYWADIVIKTTRNLFLVEVKPKLDDVGGAIRQIKHYKKLLGGGKIRCVVATYDPIPVKLAALLEHEEISVVQFENDSRVMLMRGSAEWEKL